MTTNISTGYITWAWLYRGACLALISIVLWLANDKYESDKQSRKDAYQIIDHRLDRIEAALFIPRLPERQALK